MRHKNFKITNLILLCLAAIGVNAQIVKDIDGNIYKTVAIGNQVWMAENLKTTKFNDGVPIQMVTDNYSWKKLTTPGYCWYDNNPAFGNTYGAIYNGYVVESGRICPIGWMVPTNKDWDELQNAFGNYAGNQLKEQGDQHWKNNSKSATNETGFSALGSGYRNSIGLFQFINETGVWWTNTIVRETYLATRTMYGSNASVTKGEFTKTSGNTIRCIKVGSDQTVKEVEPQSKTVSDIEGNVYKTVTIGNQVWMAENLRTTKYNNGNSIPVVVDNLKWKNMTSGGLCWYDNDKSKNNSTYGVLYNGYVIETDMICPIGWHVPSDEDWNELQQYYGNYAGLQLKAQGTLHWKNNSVNVTNETGFSALGGGYRNTTGLFQFINETGLWWTSTTANQTNLVTRAMYGNNASIAKGSYSKNTGASIRCKKD